nr:putative ribonuclease H protein At1g65750 family [Tanacetum cinerariifolium]
MISPTQGAFVPSQQITDNIVIVQEALHSMRQKRGEKGYMAIKIVLAKAYDRLYWDFIRDTLLEMKIPQLLLEIIILCVTTPSMKILWNGEPTDAFRPSKGIRQGDPLSLYLFVMCMERFNHVIEEAVDHGQWKLIYYNRGRPKLTNLFFVDDIILFAEATSDQAHLIEGCLQCFCDSSREIVSFLKSYVCFSSNVLEERANEVSGILGIDHTDDLGFYLGMPTINGRVTKATFQHIIDKVYKRLSGWKAKCISLSRRTTLIKSVLSSLAYYSMQTIKFPRSVCDSVDQKSRMFIWGGSNDKKKIHLLSWNTLQRQRKEGGLGYGVYTWRKGVVWNEECMRDYFMPVIVYDLEPARRDEEIPIYPILFMHTKLKEMSDALFKDDMRKQGCYKIRKEVFISLVTPPDGWVMLNTNGASRGNPRDAGGGEILQDDRGHFIRAFDKNYGICTSTISELLAIIREWEVKLEHCYLEANRAADWLANHGCEQKEILLMFDSAPPNHGLILLEDIKGVSWHRIIVAS